eukprot:symbB.v1.2.029309.t1/scaffold3193.1/size61566/4
MMLSERKLLEAPGADTPECQKKICPIESPCQIQDHEAKCVFVSLANLQALEVLLGVVVGVPLAICIPCTLHWFFRKVRGKSWGPRKPTRSTTSRTSYPSGTVLGRQEEVEKGDSEDSNRALTEVKGEEEVCGYQPRVEEDLDLDDGLDDLFTPLAKTVEEEIAQEEAENELDLLFTPKPKVKKASPAKTDHPKPELKVPSSVGGESEFSALFHKRLGASKHGPSRRSQEEAAMSDLHSNFSEGMSVLFASLKYLQAQKSKAPHSSPQVDASIISGNHMSTVESNVDWLDLDLGDPPDFFHFALRIASTSGQHLEALGPTMGPRRPSEDSLADMEPDEFLDGKCAFRFVFNASSPKPGSLVDTLTCNELCGDDRKGKVIFKAELSGNFVLPLLQLSATSVSFRYLWERQCPLHPLSEPLVLKNVSPLEAWPM